MAHHLIIVASALADRGNSGALAADYARAASAAGDACDVNMLAYTPPPPLDAAFVEAAFTPADIRTDGMRRALAYSDREIARLRRVENLLIATPMYNFGLPGLLKGWFDQIIRPHETFEPTGMPLEPYRGLISVRRCVVLTTRGSHAFAPAGPYSQLNFLDGHLSALLALIGIRNFEAVDCSGLDEPDGFSSAIIAEARRDLCQEHT